MLDRRRHAALRVIAVATVSPIAVLTIAVLTTVPAAARVGASAATVTLQVVPRGQGTILGGAEVGGRVCSASREPADCKWQVPAGTRVQLTGKPSGSTHISWSTPDCPGSAPCTVTLDQNTTVVALLGKLTLEVDTSGADSDDLVTSEPPGIHCPGKCELPVDAGTTVKLTTRSVSGSSFTGYPYGCESSQGASCTLRVLDEPQQVGVRFNGAQGPVASAVVGVSLRVQKVGGGTGEVTADKLSCGGSCAATYPYGTQVRFAAAGTGGSRFRGWGGVCADDATPRCTLPVGPVTILHPRFEPDAAPSAPGAPRVAERSSTSLTVAWEVSTDDVGVRAYEVYVGDEQQPRATTAGLEATLRGLRCGRSYALAVLAVDTAGHRSVRTPLFSATAPCALRIVAQGGTLSGGRIVCRFRSSTSTHGRASLLAGPTVLVSKRVAIQPGANLLVFRLPASVHVARVRVLLRVGSHAYAWSVATNR